MARRWILDHETKGTGAEMVPLDKAHPEDAPAGHPVIVAPERKPPPKREPAPRGPRRFRVVDVMTRAVLVEDAPLRATLDALRGARSTVDVSVYVWEERAAKWQQLTQREQKMLWDMAATRGG